MHPLRVSEFHDLEELTMTIRLQELHSAAVHLPITLFPAAIGADLVGRLTGNPKLYEVGRLGIRAAAVGAIASAISGLIAQEEVNVEGETMDMLITHRNLNLTATVLSAFLASRRSKRERPTIGYLATGLAGIGVLSFSAYLGGTLVYKHGVGVAPAGGQYRDDAPELGEPGQTGAFVKDATTDLARGAAHLAKELAQGRIAPTLGVGRSEVQSEPKSEPETALHADDGMAAQEDADVAMLVDDEMAAAPDGADPRHRRD